MKSFQSLVTRERLLIEKAFEASEHSVLPSGHKVGSTILCDNKEIYLGATNTRSRAIGSTKQNIAGLEVVELYKEAKKVLKTINKKKKTRNSLRYNKESYCQRKEEGRNMGTHTITSYPKVGI